MIEGYSIMDWLTLSGVVATIGAIIGVLITNSRDNKGLSKEHDGLSKGHEDLSKEHEDLEKKISSEAKSIKNDTTYIRDEMLAEKIARQSLYQNTSRAKEILETIDIMEEVVHQNAALHAEISDLKVKNQELLDRKQSDNSSKLLHAINQFDRKLGEFEMYSESEEIHDILKKITNELSEYLS
ncbi:hypothetical protein [Streptococcus mutans]|uniref:hypothetical protein n=1 Tax=Streptococcus mutans TaxID=1309 RepID=UPI0014552E4C|nr:hypothetical protein [Streptococcus mutans]NLQ60873.1 hypothetical protein [Streptococcus mutans]